MKLMNVNFIVILSIFLMFNYANSKNSPNIIFFIADDQFKTMMNFMPEGKDKNGKGKYLTPNIDALAEEGTVMLQQYVTSPVCTPSRFACLTGKFPSRSKSQDMTSQTQKSQGQTVVMWNSFVTENDITLAKIFRNNGYFTGMVGKNHVVEFSGRQKPEWNADINDPEMLKTLKHNDDLLKAACKKAGFDYAESLYHDNPTYIGVKALDSHNTDWITNGALKFINKSKSEKKPFFLWMATTIPHGPHADDRSWNADPRISALGLLDKPLNVQPSRGSIPKRLKDFGVKKWLHQKETILWMDDSIGAVIKKLKENGQYDNTIFVYFNDHGQKSKGTIYQGGVHTGSFIWKKGGFPAGKSLDIPVSNIDFAPTLLELANISIDEKNFDGKSFASLLQGKTQQIHDSLFFELGYVRGVLKDGWKYIALRYPENAKNASLEKRKRILKRFNKRQKKHGRPIYTQDPNAPYSHIVTIPGGGDAEHMSMGKYPAFYDADQLYNIKNDPNEQKNIAKDPKNKEKLEELKKELKKYLNDLPGTFGELKKL